MAVVGDQSEEAAVHSLFSSPVGDFDVQLVIRIG